MSVHTSKAVVSGTWLLLLLLLLLLLSQQHRRQRDEPLVFISPDDIAQLNDAEINLVFRPAITRYSTPLASAPQRRSSWAQQ